MSGARIAAILDAVGWQAALRSLDTGQRVIQAADYENAGARSVLQEIAASEGGVLFMSRDGKVTFHDAHYRLNDVTSAVTLSNVPSGAELPLSDAQLVYREDRIANRVAVTQTGTDLTAGRLDLRSSMERELDVHLVEVLRRQRLGRLEREIRREQRVGQLDLLYRSKRPLPDKSESRLAPCIADRLDGWRVRASERLEPGPVWLFCPSIR